MHNPYKDLEKAITNKFKYEELNARPKKTLHCYVRLHNGSTFAVAELTDRIAGNEWGLAYYEAAERFYILSAKEQWNKMIECSKPAGHLIINFNLVSRGYLETQGPVVRRIDGSHIAEFYSEEV